MAVAVDRVKDALLALLGMSEPRVDYFTTYRCKVVKQSADLTKVDIIPDDKRIPQRSDVPIKWGFPGMQAKIAPGCFMNHGWDNGDPSLPYVTAIEDGATVLEVTIKAATALYLGDKTGAKKIALEGHTHSAGGLTAPAGTAGGPVTGVSGPPLPAGLTTITKGT